MLLAGQDRECDRRALLPDNGFLAAGPGCVRLHLGDGRAGAVGSRIAVVDQGADLVPEPTRMPRRRPRSGRAARVVAHRTRARDAGRVGRYVDVDPAQIVDQLGEPRQVDDDRAVDGHPGQGSDGLLEGERAPAPILAERAAGEIRPALAGTGREREAGIPVRMYEGGVVEEGVCFAVDADR